MFFLFQHYGQLFVNHYYEDNIINTVIYYKSSYRIRVNPTTDFFPDQLHWNSFRAISCFLKTLSQDGNAIFYVARPIMCDRDVMIDYSVTALLSLPVLATISA